MDRVEFNRAAKTIAKAYGTQKSKLFERSKKPHIVEPRHLLWYVCDKNGMRNTYIENFTEENGLKVKHSTIIRGISRAVQVVKTNDLVRKLSEKLIK
tara:strand:- start:151 stop:441 length:291 start_codon:yes stop_codon:yes gene_type:complete